MSEAKKKLNIQKITAKNILLLFFLTVVLAIIGFVAKKSGKGLADITKIETVHAQGCWTLPSGGSCGCADAECIGVESCVESCVESSSADGTSCSD